MKTSQILSSPPTHPQNKSRQGRGNRMDSQFLRRGTIHTCIPSNREKTVLKNVRLRLLPVTSHSFLLCNHVRNVPHYFPLPFYAKFTKNSGTHEKNILFHQEVPENTFREIRSPCAPHKGHKQVCASSSKLTLQL
jgi:hypothetical protein